MTHIFEDIIYQLGIYLSFLSTLFKIVLLHFVFKPRMTFVDNIVIVWYCWFWHLILSYFVFINIDKYKNYLSDWCQIIGILPRYST